MKATGIIRRVDPLGRIVLPKELRGTYNINPGTPLEMYVEGDGVNDLKTGSHSFHHSVNC